MGDYRLLYNISLDIITKLHWMKMGVIPEIIMYM